MKVQKLCLRHASLKSSRAQEKVDAGLRDLLSRIRAVALDIDGVLTDGTFWWGAQGEEFKRFSFRDVMGVSRGSKAGLIFALISGEGTPQVGRFAAKLGITDMYGNCKDKAGALRAFARAHDFELSEVAFMGDDVNDLSALAIAGLPAAPADAHDSAKSVARFVAQRKAGNGAVRELIDAIIANTQPPTSNTQL
jgi:3-deoxy-D-manno-octulosonate 8-phosphate phosphatase (KDO 8-P phosphatase)